MSSLTERLEADATGAPSRAGRGQAPERARWTLLPPLVAVAALAALAVIDRTLVRDPSALGTELGASFVALGAVVAVSSALLARARHTGLAASRDATRLAHHLDALSSAALSLTADLELTSVLQKVVDLSRRVIDCRYGALAVLGPGGVIEEFVTSGIDAETRARLGPPPTGHGLLGLAIERRQPLRVEDIAQHPDSVGFPPGHPAMRGLVAVPVVFEGDAIGSLYLTEKAGGAPFTAEDEWLLTRFAAHAAIAVANARLYRRVQHLSVLDERERIAMDLHDGALQSLFAVSLNLSACADMLQSDPQGARAAIDSGLDQLTAVATDIRAYVQDLRGQRTQEDGLIRSLERLLDSLEGTGDLQHELFAQGSFADVPQPHQWALWHFVHEALSNAVRHGQPGRIDVHVQHEGGQLRCAVQDDGLGFDVTTQFSDTHHGLRNMRRRIESLGGRVTFISAPGRGTTVIAELPLAAAGRTAAAGT